MEIRRPALPERRKNATFNIMNVSEIFTSIQGESSHAGRPCTFIRLSGCNLRCSYCDTAYSYVGTTELTEDEVMAEVSKAGIKLVEVTGGEPLLQPDALHLIERLLDEGYEALVETNGSLSIEGIDRRASVIMDVKTPGSAMDESLNMGNLALLKPSDEVKFVISDEADYEWAKDFVLRHSLTDKCSVLFSAAFGRLSPKTLSGWILGDRLNVRLNLQIHKFIQVR